MNRLYPIILVSLLCLIGQGSAYGQVNPLEILSRDVLISNDNTQMHFAWLHESPNGNWYMNYRLGPHGSPSGDQVQLIKSSDQGQTWVPWPGIVYEPRFYQFFPTRLPDDSLLAYRMEFENLVVQPDGTTSGTQDLYRSVDDGETWTDYVAPVTGTPYSTDTSLKTLWGTGVQMPDGRLLMGIISREGGSLAGIVESTDNGASFQFLSSVIDDPSVGQRREPGLVLTDSGDLLAVIRTGTNTSNMVMTRSSDGGQTWGTHQVLSEPGVAPALLQLDGGALVMSYGTRNYVHTSVSWDDGNTWSTPLSLYEGQGTGYTSIQALSANSYRVVFDESTFEVFQPGGNRVVRLEVQVDPMTFREWAFDTSGDWGDSSKWSPGSFPNLNDRTAVFGPAITEPRTVFINTAITVKDITFGDTDAGTVQQTYGIAGLGSVNLSSDTNTSTISVLEGSHQFQVIVNLNNATDVSIATGATLTFNNALNLNGNTLTKTGAGIMDINNVLNMGGGSVVIAAGAMSGSGEITGDLINDSGTVAPGNSPGTLAVNGNYSQSESGILAIELAGLAQGSEYDLLDISGIASIDGGVLDVSLLGDFNPVEGDLFDVLNFSAIIGTGFDVLNLPELGSGLAWDTSQLLIDGSLAVAATSVPEPAAVNLVVMALGVLAMVGYRRRGC